MICLQMYEDSLNNLYLCSNKCDVMLMKRHFGLLVFLLLLTCSVTASVVSYQKQLHYIRQDVDHALSIALQRQLTDHVDADTIQCYRSHIITKEIRDTAYIAVRTVHIEEGERTILEANAGCSFATVFALSNQRTSGLMAMLTLLWSLAMLFRRKSPAAPIKVECILGSLAYSTEEQCFCTAEGTRLRLTPLQEQLMELFFRAPTHYLTKQDICQALWPGKPDGSETLYTLVRRLKPTLESHNLTLLSERGRGYRLKPL